MFDEGYNTDLPFIRYVAANGALEGLALVRNKTVEAYISEGPSLEYYAGLKPCDLTVRLSKTPKLSNAASRGFIISVAEHI